MDALADLIGDSPAMVALRRQVQQLVRSAAVAVRPPSLLILGETGSGKGLLARSLHRAGPRAAQPFIDVNCAAIPERLLEAELFGYEKGAFTDARQAKPGLFQLAHRGMLFLDEIGLLAAPLQAKLLTALEQRAVRRLGGTRAEPADVWIVAATNEDLRAAVAAQSFRQDLYHRLAVVTLTLPPLRERGLDVLILAEHLLARACADYGLAERTFSPDARDALAGYSWPGNVRELGQYPRAGGPAERCADRHRRRARPVHHERGGPVARLGVARSAVLAQADERAPPRRARPDQLEYLADRGGAGHLAQYGARADGALRARPTRRARARLAAVPLDAGGPARGRSRAHGVADSRHRTGRRRHPDAARDPRADERALGVARGRLPPRRPGHCPGLGRPVREHAGGRRAARQDPELRRSHRRAGADGDHRGIRRRAAGRGWRDPGRAGGPGGAADDRAGPHR